MARSSGRNSNLETYQAKRDFTQTPEPAGRVAKESAGAEGRFVVQEHHARRLHWDLRLERDGVLASWAVPKGIPVDPKRNHLAVRTEDHPLEYLNFQGEIPQGSYGAGVMRVWDRGTYRAEKWSEREVMVTLDGERVHGKYVLFRTRGNDWMIHRMDPPEDPTREPMPERIEPMLATRGRLPTAPEGWAYEPRWQGERSIIYVDGGRARITLGSGEDVSDRFPELRGIGNALGATEAILDGMIVAPRSEAGSVLERRLAAGSASTARRLAKESPVSYVAFDLLWLDGHSMLEHSYRDRRARLDGLALNGVAWQTPAAHTGDPRAFLEAARDAGLTGMVAKREDSKYQPGRQARTWKEVLAPVRTRNSRR
jgi:bifunctional non-homologous end joining protein LigD